MLYLFVGLVIAIVLFVLMASMRDSQSGRIGRFLQNILWTLLGAATIGLLLWVIITGKFALLWVPLITILPWLLRAIRAWRFYQFFRSGRLHNFWRNLWQGNTEGKNSHWDNFTTFNGEGRWRDENAGPQKNTGDMTRHEAAKILGVSPQASEQEIRHAWQQQISKHHPDQGGNPEKAASINRARDVLLPH